LRNEIWNTLLKLCPQIVQKSVVWISTWAGQNCVPFFFKKSIHFGKRSLISPNFHSRPPNRILYESWHLQLKFYTLLRSVRLKLRPLHSVSSQDFRSFLFLYFFSKIVQLKFFREIATITSRLLSFDKFFPAWTWLLNFLCL
jgi:hypothetical protein